MRNPSFHFAMRSDLANEPTFNIGEPQPTAKWTIVTSSVSPERAETIALQPSPNAASIAAFASVNVPAWFGLIKAVLQACRAAALGEAQQNRRQCALRRNRGYSAQSTRHEKSTIRAAHAASADAAVRRD